MVVALSGYYGFGNAGDEAILMSIVREARRRGIEPLVLSANPAASEKLHQVRTAPRSAPQTLLALSRSDGLLSGGGGLLQDATSARSLSYYLTLLRVAQLLKKPNWVFGQSLGPLSARGMHRTASVLRRATSVTVRDRTSLELAQQMKINARLGADAALLLEPPGVTREERLVVLVPRGHLAHEANQRLREAGERLLSLGYEVLVLGLQPNHDEEALDHFRGFTRELSGDPRRILYWLAQAGYVLSLRLHGLILAAAAGTPYAGGSYDPKVKAFCEESGAPYWELPGDPEAMVRVALHGSGPDKSALRDLRLRAAESFNWLWGRPRADN